MFFGGLCGYVCLRYCLGNFPQCVLCNVARGNADGVKGLGRVKINDCPEILMPKILLRIYAAAGHQHKGCTVCGKPAVHILHVKVINPL